MFLRAGAFLRVMAGSGDFIFPPPLPPKIQCILYGFSNHLLQFPFNLHLRRDLQAAALQPGYRAGGTHGSGGGGGGASGSSSLQGEVEAALRSELADLRRQLEAAEAAAEAAGRELRQQRHRTQEAEAQVGTQVLLILLKPRTQMPEETKHVIVIGWNTTM